MRMSSEPSREEIDRLRGLARAAWARLQRDDLDDEQSASAQEEYARTRDELLDLGIGIEVTEQQSLTFVEEEEIVEDYDPELLIECIDGSMDPIPLRNLTRIVDLAGFLKTPVCAAIGKWAMPRLCVYSRLLAPPDMGAATHWDRALEVAYQLPAAQCGHN